MLDRRTYGDADIRPIRSHFGAAQTGVVDRQSAPVAGGLEDHCQRPAARPGRQGRWTHHRRVRAFANGSPGVPSDRESEIARVLAANKANKVANVVWFTADVRYTAAHHHPPDHAAFTTSTSSGSSSPGR
ncbi:alkaline phosphatase D family protein [Nocardia sp. NPDC049190]|uniref:alkaline phosphatase D family protein n=1 Tax=Nocardia sp. NPDC049190 TaxID=3155650 RepID=UPI0033EB6297